MSYVDHDAPEIERIATAADHLARVNAALTDARERYAMAAMHAQAGERWAKCSLQAIAKSVRQLSEQWHQLNQQLNKETKDEDRACA